MKIDIKTKSSSMNTIKLKAKLSIAIVNWNSGKLLDECLRSIYKNGFFDYEVIVIDNASTDKSTECVSNYQGVKLVQNTDNFGYAVANNQAYCLSSSEYFMVLNPDTKVLDDCIEKMIEFLENNKNYTAATAVLLNEDSTIQYQLHRRFPNFFSLTTALIYYYTGWFKWFGPMRRYFYFDKDFKFDFDIEQAAGTCLMVKREAIEKIGGFYDEKNFPLYFNDVDICYRLNKSGNKIRLLSNCRIIHKKGSTTQKLTFYFNTNQVGVSALRFFRKHHKYLDYVLFKVGLIVFFVAKWLIEFLRWFFNRNKSCLPSATKTLGKLITERF